MFKSFRDNRGKFSGQPGQTGSNRVKPGQTGAYFRGKPKKFEDYIGDGILFNAV